jgi:hypothetical protein
MTVDTEYFQRMYAGSADPWEFETRWYDRRKYRLTGPSCPAPGTGRASSRPARSACCPRCSPRAALACSAATWCRRRSSGRAADWRDTRMSGSSGSPPWQP